MNEKFEDIWQRDIITPLKGISVENGYENDFTYLNGWLVHYAIDISRGVNGWSFPAIGAHPQDETITVQAKGTKYDPVTSKNNRAFRLEVAIDVVSNRETLLARLESAVRDIKKAIGTVKTRNLTLTRVKFTLPEDSEIYAFIEIDGNITYDEIW